MTIDYKQKHNRKNSGRMKRDIENDNASAIKKFHREKMAELRTDRKIEKALKFADIYNFTPLV